MYTSVCHNIPVRASVEKVDQEQSGGPVTFSKLQMTLQPDGHWKPQNFSQLQYKIILCWKALHDKASKYKEVKYVW